MSGHRPLSTDFRPPLARVIAHGSSRDGFSHWWVQRVTAVALVPLTIWFVYSVLTLMAGDYRQMVEWFSCLPNACFMVLFLVATFWHAALGAQTVIEDYIHTPGLRLSLLLVSKLGAFALGTAGVLAVLKLFFHV